MFNGAGGNFGVGGFTPYQKTQRTAAPLTGAASPSSAFAASGTDSVSFGNASKVANSHTQASSYTRDFAAKLSQTSLDNQQLADHHNMHPSTLFGLQTGTFF